MKRYDIHWVDFNPTRGAEIAKNRPAVIVSRDELNRALRTVTVCPLTTSIHSAWKTRLQIVAAGKEAEIAADQIRTISRDRIGTKIGTIDEKEAAELRRLLTDLYGE